MTMGRFAPIRCGLIVAALFGASGVFENSIQADDLQDWIAILETQGTSDLRMKTLTAIGKISKEPRSLAAIPIVTFCLKDPTPKIREAAVTTLGTILHEHKRPCPLELVRMLEDRDPQVRLAAGTYVNLFDRYPEGSLPIFKLAARHTDRRVRQSVPHLLQVAAPKDPDAIRLIEGLARDPDFHVWNNAEVSLWQITHDVERYVVFSLKVIARGKPVENVLEADKADQVLRNQTAGLAWRKLREQLEREPEATTRGLVKAGRNESAEVRRAAVVTMRVLSKENAENRSRLRSEGADVLLAGLVDDPDEEVQRAAMETLRSFHED